MIDKSSKVFITGHSGMLGKATLQVFASQGYTNLLTATHQDLELRDQKAVNEFFSREKPAYVIHLAARVGGIQANIDQPAEFLFDNLIMQANVIHAAFKNNVKKFVFIASSCIYPRDTPQPMTENQLLTGELEPTNEGYAIAKITGIKLLETYNNQYGFNGITLVPSNLYGPNDSFDLQHAHVLSSLVKRFSDAKSERAASVTLWGTGIARREFLHVDDFARAILHMFENYSSSDFINIGSGTDISIYDLATIIAQKVGYTGEIKWDSTKPDGMLRKCMDVSKMKQLGFASRKTLDHGIDEVILSYNTGQL